MTAVSTKSVTEAATHSAWLYYLRASWIAHDIGHVAQPARTERSGTPDARDLTQVAEWAAVWQVVRKLYDREKRNRKRSEIPTPPRVPESHYLLASADIRHLSSLVRQLAALRECEEADEYGVLRASEHAYNEACQLLIDATITAALERREIPDACVSTDSEGGVRIEWIRPQRSVHLVIPCDPPRQPYLYHEVGDAYGTERATAGALAYWLRGID
jgi:hypothetical protein